jgi:hypothetical protein
MADAMGEAQAPPLRIAFDRRLKFEFHGTRITSDGGLLAYRELDDALDLTTVGKSALAEGRRGKNTQHRPLGLLRQAVYGRLAGYEPGCPGWIGVRPASCTSLRWWAKILRQIRWPSLDGRDG